jgi:hypothetical protein
VAATARRRALLQALALALVLGAAAFLVYGEQLRHGGWVGDAWLTRAWYATWPHGNFFDTVGHFLELNSMGARPANAVYRVALNEWFGADMGAWFTWQALSGVCMCLSLYLLLRELGLGYLDAAAASLLLLIFPASASLWLWSAVLHASLAIALGSIGFVLALRAFRAHGRRRWALHAASLLLFVLSVLLYEVCLPAFLASVLLYRLQAPWRAACRRWLVDCLVLVPIALALTSTTEAHDQDLAGAIAHGGDIVAGLPSLLFGRLLPFGAVRPLAFVLLAALYAAGAVVARRLGAEDPARGRLRLLFGLTGAGLMLVGLGYLIYVPGLDYYTPLARGIGDRVNALAAIGWVLIVYALLSMAATLAVRGLRGRPLYAGLLTAALGLAVGLGWLASIGDESRAYVAAYREGNRALDVVERAVPDPKPGTAIWVFGQPVEMAAGVPVFANYWNMTGAVALMYHDHRVRGFVGLPGTSFECRAHGMVPSQEPEYAPPPAAKLGRFGSRYGRTYFVDTVSGQFANMRTRRECLEMSATYALSPQLPTPQSPSG